MTPLGTNHDLTNLLPVDRVRALRRTYFTRLTVVASVLAAALVVVNATLLVPTYVYLKTQEKEKSNRLEALDKSLSSADEKAFEERLSVLSKKVALVKGLGTTSPMSVVIRDVLAVPRPGIALSGFSLTPPQGTKPSSFVISGIAKTRDSLRSYQLALLDAPFSKTADLPISAYAKETDISFSITVVLTNTP